MSERGTRFKPSTASPAQFWAGWQFYRSAWAAIKHLDTNMNALIAMGTSAAYFYSVAAILFPGFFAAGGRMPAIYFDSAAVIIGLILLGKFLEARAKGQTGEAIKKLMGMQARTARVIRDGRDVDVPVESKAGTLTQGKPVVTDLMPAKGTSPENLLALAAAAERGSEHLWARRS